MALTRDKKIKLKRAVTELLDSEISWPVFDNPEIFFEGLESIASLKKTMTVRELFDVHHNEHLVRPKNHIVTLLMLNPRALLEKFEHEHPHIDIAAIAQYSCGQYPYRQKIQNDIDQLEESYPTDTIKNVEEHEKKVIPLYEEIGRLPSRKDVLANLVDNILKGLGKDSDQNLKRFLFIEKIIDDRLDELRAQRSFAISLSMLEFYLKLDDSNPDKDRLIEKILSRLEKCCGRLEPYTQEISLEAVSSVKRQQYEEARRKDPPTIKTMHELQHQTADVFCPLRKGAQRILGIARDTPSPPIMGVA